MDELYIYFEVGRSSIASLGIEIINGNSARVLRTEFKQNLNMIKQTLYWLSPL